MLLEPSHRLPLMLLPVTNVVPLLLDWLPHPKALYCGELGIGGHIRRDQQQLATSGATSLLPKSEIPLAVRALVTPRSESHKSLLGRVAYLRTPAHTSSSTLASLRARE